MLGLIFDITELSEKQKDLIKNGALGELMFLRARYGHGGRIGYDSEWRADPDLSGGGELIDQGPHLTDLSDGFLKKKNLLKFKDLHIPIFGICRLTIMALCYLKLRNRKLHFFMFRAVNGKIFFLEIYGKQGKLEILVLEVAMGLNV